MKIQGKNIFLKILSIDDINEDYLEWMQDEDVMQFLESRWKSYSFNDIKEYVESINNSPDDYLLGIFLKENEKHIGNIKIGNINHIHGYGDIGLLIGKNYWGKRCGKESIELATKYAFDELNLNKLFAGIYSNNIASYKSFIKAGYKEIGRLKNHFYYEGKYIDNIIVEKLNSKFEGNSC